MKTDEPFDGYSPELTVAHTLKMMRNHGLTFGQPPGVVAEWLKKEADELVSDSCDRMRLRRTLAIQMGLLERMFQHFVTLASQEGVTSECYDRLMRLAMRAQSQCVRTASVLTQLNGATREPESAPPPAAPAVVAQPDETPEASAKNGARLVVLPSPTESEQGIGASAGPPRPPAFIPDRAAG